MADSVEEGESNNSKLEKPKVSMDVDSAPTVELLSKHKDDDDTKKLVEGRENEEDEFQIVEEEDGDDDTEDQGTRTIKPMDATISPPAEETKVKEENMDDAKKEDQGDEILLANPLFGKNAVPLIDIESSSSSDENGTDEEDFSEDMAIYNFEKADEDGEKNGEVPGSELPQRPLANAAKYCGCDCYHEKGILVNEIERLRKAVYELNERHSVLEDFIEVEYSDRFEKFLKNREHLVSMGFGGAESEGSADIVDGKRSAKSAELIELLKMIKEQANEKEKPGTNTSTVSNKPASTTSKGGGGGGGNPLTKTQQKSIPSIASQRDRGSGGRGGAHSYDQRSVIVPNAAYALSMNYQYQQQQLLAHQQQEAQARQYYQSMYGHGNVRVRDERDYITAVGRTQLYPQGFRYESGGRPGGGGGGGGESKESKKQRKRKRQSEVSSETSTAGSQKNPSNFSGAEGAKGPSKTIPVAEDDDVEVIDYNNQMVNPLTKRICPLCEKIINRKQLRDHLITIHQGHKVVCPVCKETFGQRRHIKKHMRDSHDLPVSEYTTFIEKTYSNIEEQCGTWLDKQTKEAEIPTKDQLLVYNAEIQLALLTRREERAAAESTSSGVFNPLIVRPTSSVPPASASGVFNPMKVPSSSSRGSASHSTGSSSKGGGGGGGRKDNNWGRDRNARNIPLNEPSMRYFTGANAKLSSRSSQGPSVSSAELYGAGGYAQYAARYLQQRAFTEGRSGGAGRGYSSF